MTRGLITLLLQRDFPPKAAPNYNPSMLRGGVVGWVLLAPPPTISSLRLPADYRRGPVSAYEVDWMNAKSEMERLHVRTYRFYSRYSMSVLALHVCTTRLAYVWCRGPDGVPVG